MKTANQKETNIVYQKQLFNTLKTIVELRTLLFTDAALLANEGKEKEWTSTNATLKFLKKQVEKTDDENLKVIASILTSLEEPILKLEGNLELKNSFKEIISEQTLKETAEPVLTQPS